jgi:hypothetical protein
VVAVSTTCLRIKNSAFFSLSEWMCPPDSKNQLVFVMEALSIFLQQGIISLNAKQKITDYWRNHMTSINAM